RKMNKAAISQIEEIYNKGVSTGVFRQGLDPRRIHWMISAMSFFNVSNAATFSLLFGADLQTDEEQSALRAEVGQIVTKFVVLNG
ncbi:MAG: TetR/AcrR family transcriptional regulator, partial [Hyphomicrobiales bacterium]